MKIRFLVFAATLGMATAAIAQSSENDHSAHHPPAAATLAPAAAPRTEGEVRRIDKDRGRITLRHGRIENLDMPPMTMVFTVEDKRMLETLQPGDKLRFTAEKKNGVFTVTGMERID